MPLFWRQPARRFIEEDVRALAREVPGIKAISAEYLNGSFPAKYGDKIEIPTTTGVYPVYSDIRCGMNNGLLYHFFVANGF